jgi:protein-S-isoprenylcysteine O-methyltransferase Ste14
MTLGARTLDVGERLIALALYGWMVTRVAGGYRSGGGLASVLILPSEGLVVAFLLLRRPAFLLSRCPRDWLLALAATTAPMLVSPGVGRALVPVSVAATLMVMGIGIQLHAKLTLGRSFGCVAAHRGLQLDGPYRFVRHPMYTGYLMSHLAFLLVNPTAWNLAVYAACYALQIPRLLVEERLLGGDPRYRAYAERVRWRLVPHLY